jgi:hypothetical protein
MHLARKPPLCFLSVTWVLADRGFQVFELFKNLSFRATKKPDNGNHKGHDCNPMIDP